jgi:hypothetical protein
VQLWTHSPGPGAAVGHGQVQTPCVIARPPSPRGTSCWLESSSNRSRPGCCAPGVFRYIPKPWSEPQLLADLQAALVFDPCAIPSADELERRGLEALEPGIKQVEWGSSGEVLMPGHLPTRPGKQ